MSVKQYEKFSLLLMCMVFLYNFSSGQVLDKQAMLMKFSFWHNRDWDWYKANIPFFESPDNDIDLTYYYRWEMMTAHMVYGSVESGYASTEFIDRPGWSGSFGAISCPAGHQLYEYRWLKNRRYFNDYARYWFRTPGAQPRSYTNWIADAIWQGYKVNRNKDFVLDIKKDLINNYNEWEKEHWVEEEGMFAWDGMHDGMETNINSRQTKDWFAGAPGYRPTINSYLWADALAISNISNLGNDVITANIYSEKAAIIKKNLLEKCWDAERNFFFHRFKNDEEGGIKANTLTYQTGKYAGNPHGREEIGFVPWYFNMPDPGYESAWQFAMDSNFFYSPYGPTTVEKNDPLFLVAKNCCAWSGNAWPFATSQTLKAMANVIKYYKQNYVNKNDYFNQLKVFAITHRKNGKPYIAEANNPQTGSWSGHDNIGHSDHYFHSAFVDEIITGLVGLTPSDKDSIEVNPLIPDSWNYFALDDVIYHGHRISIVWDKDGKKYQKGKGLQIFSDGKLIASAPAIQKLVSYISYKNDTNTKAPVNYAVNNSKNQFYPRAVTLFPGLGDNMYLKINDGQYWYYTSTTNRWSSLGSGNKVEWCGVDFGADRPVNTVKVYFVEDSTIKAPLSYRLQYWKDTSWKDVEGQKRNKVTPQANKASIISFNELYTSKLRVLMQPQKGSALGISEFETWGNKVDILAAVPEPQANNLAYKSQAKVSVSYTSPFDRVSGLNDGLANPTARWTAFKSPNKTDWIQFDLANTATVSKAYLYFYSDKAGVQPPKDYIIQYWNDSGWQPVPSASKQPEQAIEGLNICSFKAISTNKLRFVFEHKSDKSFTGLYEVELY